VDTDVALPRDGTPVYVSEWRRAVLWLPVVVYSLIGIGLFVVFLSEGAQIVKFIAPLAFGLTAAASVRMAVAGLILGPTGVEARGFTRTRSWRWDEISRFEIRPRRMPRLAIVLKSGAEVGVYGFYASSSKERERAESLLAALESRREVEVRNSVPSTEPL
jgi:hypothetical protein